MATYAKETTVSTDKSRIEIERTLERYGATAFMYGWEGDRSLIGFQLDNKRYRLILPMPEKSDFRLTDTGRARTRDSINNVFEQAQRQRWRAMALYIKAILEAAETGIITVENALQPYMLLPNGMTVGQWLSPQIDQIYLTSNMPPMLGAGSEGQ